MINTNFLHSFLPSSIPIVNSSVPVTSESNATLIPLMVSILSDSAGGTNDIVNCDPQAPPETEEIRIPSAFFLLKKFSNNCLVSSLLSDYVSPLFKILINSF